LVKNHSQESAFIADLYLTFTLTCVSSFVWYFVFCELKIIL